MEDIRYINDRVAKIKKSQELVIQEGSPLIKTFLTNEWFTEIIQEEKRVCLDPYNCSYNGIYFAYRWLFEDSEWNYISEGFTKLHENMTKKKVLRNKFKDIMTNDWNVNSCAAFEIEVLCKLYEDEKLKDIDPFVSNTTTKRADAAIDIDGRNILVEVSSFQTDISKKSKSKVSSAPIDKNVLRIIRKMEYKTEHQLKNATDPTVLIITIPDNIRCDHIQANFAINQYLSNIDNICISAILVADSYLFKYGAWYFNQHAKNPLSIKETNYFKNCLKLNGNLSHLQQLDSNRWFF